MKPNQTILVIEDNADVAELIQSCLEGDGLTVKTISDGAAGLEAVIAQLPELVILDMGLPTMRGVDVCKKLKQDERTRKIPLIFLTAKADESDVVLGLEMGADDYIAKPFRPKELVARVRATLRKSRDLVDGVTLTRLSHGGITLDSSRFEAKLNENSIPLTQFEFRILWALLEHPGMVHTRDRLMKAAGQQDVHVVERTVDVHMAHLRQKLGPLGERIFTIRGVGYKWAD